MKKNLLTFFVALFATSFVVAQTVIIDHEAPETTTNFQFFGGDLEGMTNNIVDNPAPDANNMSATVGEFMKLVSSPVWGGGFSNPNPTVPVDLTTDNQICVDVHMPFIGNLGLKIENSTNGGDNWIRTVDNVTVNAWEQLCFDVSLPSIEAPFTAASGFTYSTVVLFFDFQIGVPEDRTYYFDNIITQTGTAVTEGDITFSVDVSEFADPVSTVNIFGTFNDFDPTNIPMTDDGNGIWSVTVADIPVGAQEYKFLVNGQEETLNRYSPCTTTFDDGGGNVFTNRALGVAGDATIPTVCYGSCYECGNSIDITINLGTSNIMVAGDGVYIAGGGNFANPGDFPLTDDDGDGIYSITVERQIGFESFYTFTNGACPDYSCKEDISGQDCANPDNFNDRFMGPFTEDATISTCFAICTESADDCGTGNFNNVTFSIDMNTYTGAFTQPYISGTFNNFSGDANPLEDPDGDNVWSTTLSLAANDYEYKFQVDQWTDDEIFMDGDPCTITDPSGVFVNRFISVSEDAEVCFQWASCEMCIVSTNDLTIADNLFEIAPTLTADHAFLTFNNEFAGEKNIRVFNLMGELVHQSELAPNAENYRVDVASYANGIYMVHVQVGEYIATKKIMKF